MRTVAGARLASRRAAIGFAVAGVAMAVQAASELPADATRARALYDAGSFAEAAPLFEKLAAASPSDGILQHQLGVCLEMTARREEGQAARRRAIPLLEKAARGDVPPVTVAYYLVGDYQAVDPAKVPPLLERVASLAVAGKLRAATPSEQYQLATLLERAGKAKEAEALLREALAGLRKQAAPPRRYLSDALVRLGNLDVERKDHAAASAKFDEARKVDPGNPGAPYVKGVVLDAQGKIDEARAEYEAALALDPRHFYAQFNLANLAARQGRLGEALAGFEKGLALDPQGDDLVRALLAAAKVAEAAGELRKASELYGRLSRVRPGPEAELSARYTLAHALVAEGKGDEGLKILREVATHAPDLPALRAEIAAILLQRKDYQGAVSELLAALALAPSEGRLYLELGRAYRALGKGADADAAFRKAKDIPATAAEAERELAAPKGASR